MIGVERAQFFEDDCMMFLGQTSSENFGMAVGCKDWVWKGTILGRCCR